MWVCGCFRGGSGSGGGEGGEKKIIGFLLEQACLPGEKPKVDLKLLILKTGLDSKKDNQTAYVKGGNRITNHPRQ